MFIAYPSILASWFEKSSLIGWSLKEKTAKQPISDRITSLPMNYEQYLKRRQQRERDTDSNSLSDSSSDVCSQLSGYDPSISSCSDMEYFTAMSSQSQSDNEDLLNSSLSSLSDLEIDLDQRSLGSKSGSCLSSDLEYITAASYSSFSEYESSSLKSGSYYTAFEYTGKSKSRPASWESDLEYETARSRLSSSASDLDNDNVTPKVRLKRDTESRYSSNGNSGSYNNNNNSELFMTKYQSGYMGYADSDLTSSVGEYGNGGASDSGPEYSTAVSDLEDCIDLDHDFVNVKLHISGKLEMNSVALTEFQVGQGRVTSASICPLFFMIKVFWKFRKPTEIMWALLNSRSPV